VVVRWWSVVAWRWIGIARELSDSGSVAGGSGVVLVLGRRWLGSGLVAVWVVSIVVRRFENEKLKHENNLRNLKIIFIFYQLVKETNKQV
jgi:hypothetical protein